MADELVYQVLAFYDSVFTFICWYDYGVDGVADRWLNGDDLTKAKKLKWLKCMWSPLAWLK